MSKYFVALMVLLFSPLSFSGVYKCTERGEVVYTSTKKDGCVELKSTLGAYSKDDRQVKTSSSQTGLSGDDDKQSVESAVSKVKSTVSGISREAKQELASNDIDVVSKHINPHVEDIQNITNSLP
ncbi:MULTISPECIES: DUF4124 domain-containing protein [Candidatus Ichthyocystis]|uniref:DUF4124 domain-containing protein n=1 Tax=Candidatus Ichthyocystis TaxID=2929841 RepID=UPI000B80CA05|nr:MULTISPECIES: DUF4124 domain-containing protein [Ichthyocystis]